MTVSRRALLGGLAALAAASGSLALTGCGTDDPEASGSTSPSASGGAEAGAFPVTITHRYGDTTIEAEPTKIVTVGLKEQDDLLALGISPVGATVWLTELPEGGIVGPWATAAFDETGAEAPEVLDQANGQQFEKIAALAPDLIIALYTGITKDDYTKLEAIAPVVAAPKDYNDYGIPWDVQAEIVGKAVGRPAQMAEVITASKKAMTDVVAANPDFKGQTSMVVTPYEGIYVYGKEDPRVRLMLDLGFVLPDGFDEALDTGTSFGGNISAERADIMDVDALICFAEEGKQQKEIETALFKKLDVSTEGRVVWLRLSDKANAPFSFLTALSLPYLLENFVPRVVAADDGDPSTSTDQAA